MSKETIYDKLKDRTTFFPRLFRYNYTEYCQGTADRGTAYALIYAPADASFNNVRSVLYNQKNIEHHHEIDLKSVEDLTLMW